MKLTSLLLKISLLLLVALLSLAATSSSSAHDDGDGTAKEVDDAVFLWSSTGGGWRAMMACVGFVNVFRQAGLFTHNSTSIKGIATNSGASWFLVQLFYSQAFYDQTVMASTPDEIYNFTMTWMRSYLELASEATLTLDAIETFVTNVTNITRPELDQDIAEIERDIYQIAEQQHLQLDDPAFQMAEHNVITLLFELFDLYVYSNASWAWFVEDMLTRGTNAIGHEGDFASIMADGASRLQPMQNTTFMVQTTLAPSSKVRLASAFHNFTNISQWQYGDVNLNGEWAHLAPLFGNLAKQDMEVFLGPYLENATTATKEDWQLYSLGLNAHYMVNSTFEGFQYAAFDSDSSTTLSSYASPTQSHFDWHDYEGYYLWPNENFWDWPTDGAASTVPASLVMHYNHAARNMTPTGTMAPPFGGGPATVIQAASISSAAAGPASAASPVVFAQVLSEQRDNVRNMLDDPFMAVGALTAFDLAVQQIYQHPLTDGGAVCSQWPERPCGPNDGYFMDGAFSDNPAVAINIATYQQSQQFNLSKTIKLVLTNTNQNINPNSYDTQQLTQYFATDYNQNVPPGGYVWLPGFVVPYRSPQIFMETLTDDDVMLAIEPIEGSNMSTAIYKATTLANPAFGTVAGQSVEILMLNTNKPITTFIAALEIIKATLEPLANMTWEMAGNQELVDRVRHFFFGDEDEDSEESKESEDSGVEEDEKEEEEVNPPLDITRSEKIDTTTTTTSEEDVLEPTATETDMQASEANMKQHQVMRSTFALLFVALTASFGL